MDRFSSPLTIERVNPFQLQYALEEQNRLNKKQIVVSFIDSYLNEYDRLPDVYTVSEGLYQIDLDDDLITDEINFYHYHMRG